MTKDHKPVSGSRGFWPRKRARRIYPSPKARAAPGKPLPVCFAAYKAGMTKAVYTDTRKNSPTSGQDVTVPVTVFDAPPLTCIAVKVYRKTPDGLKDLTTIHSEKLPKDLPRKTKLPKKIENKSRLEQAEKQLSAENADKTYDIRLLVSTNPRDSGTGKKKPEIFELPLGGTLKDKWAAAREKLGTELLAKDVFQEGELVDVSAVSKGKGFQGPVKRFGVKIRQRKHEKKRRHVGNIGAVTPARVLPGKIAMAGQLGFQTRTELNKKILKLGDGGLNPKGDWLSYGRVKDNYIVLEGSVPGPRKRLVIFMKSVRPREKEAEKVEVKKVILNSLQGV